MNFSLPNTTLTDIRAVLVDLDGTMVDTLGDFTEALNRMLVDLALPAVPASAIEHMVGKGSEHLIRSVLAYAQKIQLNQPVAPDQPVQAAIDVEALYTSAWQSYERHYLAINGQFANLYPGVLEGLQALAGQGIPLVCLTNKPLSFAEPLLQAKGISHFFAHVFGGDSFPKKKPDPMPLVKSCEILGTQPAQTLMVGDSSNDAAAARAAGCPVVLVSYGYNHGEPVQAVDCDACIDSLAQLRD